MEKVYRCKNGTIFVTLPESSDREELKKVTEEFLKKVISGGKKENGNSGSCKDFRKQQVLHR